MIPTAQSLRTRLMLLVIVAAIPAFGVIGYFTWWMYNHENERRQDDLLGLAKSLAEKHRENLDDARMQLVNLARMPDIRAGRGTACSEAIAAIHAQARPHVANLFVALPDGSIECSARDPGKISQVADMPWFQSALASAGFRVGEYHISRRTGAPTLVLTHTVRTQGKVEAVLGVALDLSWLAAQPWIAEQPATTAFAIFDHTGTILLRQPQRGSAGHNIAGHPHWRTLTSLKQAAIFRGPGGDNIERLFAYAPLGPASHPYARLVVGVPPAVLDAPARELFLLGLAGLAAAMGLGLLAGWLGSAALVTRPLQPVLDTVQRVAAGDLSARTPSERPRADEISKLANEVDRMAEALSRRDRALTEARDRAQAYLDVVGVMVLVLNGRGNIALANRKVCEILGCGELPLCVGGNWFDKWIPAEDREQAKADFARNLAGTESPLEFHEGRILTASGQRRLIAWHVSPLTDASGKIVGLLCAGEDISEMRQTQQALLDSRNRYQALVENIPGVVYRCAIDYPWRLDFISRTVKQITGIAAERFLDNSVRYGELIHPDDLANVELAVAEAIAERRPHACAYRLRRNDNDWRWVHEQGRAIYDAEGRPIWLDGVIVDITENKALQEEQERLHVQLQQAQKMEALGQLTGGIAHDFNNILAAVLGFAKLALRRHAPDPNSELAEYLREVVTAGERARDLVARMLAFSRAQPGRAAQPVAPHLLVKEAVKMLAATIPAGIHIDTRIDAEAPDIAIDPVDLHQILVNLVINARDALDGHGRIVISLARTRVRQQICSACHEKFMGDYLELTVADDGQGIAPEALGHIFEPFFTTKPVGQGTGMGLAMVHGLVRRAGGHFQVESSVGQGSAFHIFLPAAKPARAATAQTPAQLPPAPADGPKGHVLLVDDETAILRLLRASLESAGWRVSCFANPRQALAVFRDTPDEFTAVISDQTMPDMTGGELILALHELRPRLPAMLCTGHSDSLNPAEARQQGIQHLFLKPVDADELLTALAQTLSEKGNT